MHHSPYAIFLSTLIALAAAAADPPNSTAEAAASEAIDDAKNLRERENLANLLNYAQVSIHVINAFNNRIILDREYRTIVNNLSLREIPDHRVIELLKSLMDSLTKATLTDRERQRIERIHLNNVKNASRDRAKRAGQAALSAGLEISAAAALGAVVKAGMAYWDYQSVIDQMQAEKGEDLWAIEGEVLKEVNEINKQILDLSWQLYTEYDVPEQWRLVPDDIRELTEINRERGLEKRLRMLDRPYMRDQFSRFAPYWFYFGSTAQQLYLASGDSKYRKSAVEAYDRYELTRSPILKKDEMYASVALGRAQLLDPETRKSEIVKHLEVIESDPPSNVMTISAMALLYAQIGEHRKAREWAQHNIDRASGDETLHHQVMGQVLASAGNREALRQLIARMVAGSSAQTFEILEMVGPMDTTQVANSLRPRLLSVRPYIEMRTMRSNHILLEVPLALEADMKELSLLSGAPHYDPERGRQILNAEALYPDHVSRSENGMQVTFRFEGAFDPDEWEAEGRSHVLFLLQEGDRSIEILYEVVAQPDSDPAYRLKLDQVGIDDTQFRERGTGFVAAAPLLRAEFEASLAGLKYGLSRRYGLESDGAPSEVGAIAKAAEKERDTLSLRELVRRMKDDPNTYYLDIVEIAQSMKAPREMLQALPFSQLRVSREENLIGSAYSLGSSALSYVGAGDYGEGREDLVLRLPPKWLDGRDPASAVLVIGSQEVEGDEAMLNEDTNGHFIRFESAYHSQQWKDQEIDRVAVRFETGIEPKLFLHYRATTANDPSDAILMLEAIEMGGTRFAATR